MSYDNYDVDLAGIDSHEHPAFYDHAARAGWDDLSFAERDACAQEFCFHEAAYGAMRCADTYGTSLDELRATGILGAPPDRPGQRQERKGFFHHFFGMLRALIP